MKALFIRTSEDVLRDAIYTSRPEFIKKYSNSTYATPETLASAYQELREFATNPKNTGNVVIKNAVKDSPLITADWREEDKQREEAPKNKESEKPAPSLATEVKGSLKQRRVIELIEEGKDLKEIPGILTLEGISISATYVGKLYKKYKI